MKIEKGNIYHFYYSNYHVDKYPIALILHSDSNNTHSLNLNYLSPKMRDSVIDMIVAITTKKLGGRDTYALYHDYIKRKLPQVIRFCYRKYKTSFIRDAKLVSKGFFETRNFLWHIKKNFSQEDSQFIFKKIKTSIKEAQNVEKQDKKIAALKKWESKLTPDEFEDKAKDYIASLSQIYTPKDTNKYTFIGRRR